MRRIGILLLVLLLCGCAAPQMAMEEQATPALTPAPVSESASTPEPTPTPLPSLPPHSERVYLRVFDPPHKGVLDTDFSGEPLTRMELARFRIRLGGEDNWAAMYECLAEIGATLEHLFYVPPDYRGYYPEESGENAMYPHDIYDINDTFAMLEVSGKVDGTYRDCYLYFTREGNAYRPYAGLEYGDDWNVEHLECEGDTWMTGDYRLAHGTGYDYQMAYWYNLSDRSMELNYTSHWLQYDEYELTGTDPEEIMGFVRFWPELKTEMRPPVAYEGGAFALDVQAVITADSKYYDTEWDSEEDWQDILEARYTHRFYYDPVAQDFFLTVEDTEPYFIRSEFEDDETAVHLADFAMIFREELKELAKDELSYRADWAKLLLSELDEGGEGDEG